MQRATRVVAISLAAILSPLFAEAQTWPESRNSNRQAIEWLAGSYVPLSGLGSFGHYRLSMDPWLVAGVSLRTGAADARFRTRFEVAAVPNVAMRRSPVRTETSECPECTAESLRMTLVNSRFLVDYTFPFVSGTRAYVTAGPAMRFQFSDPGECPTASGDECALTEFAQKRIDPGLEAGLGWEPRNRFVRGIQLTGRMSLYGRGERPLAAPESMLPELNLVIRFSP
jgi:hypothetical protein